MNFHLKEKEEVISSLGSTREGLSSAESAKRLSENGKNALKAAKKKSLVRRFFEQLGDPMTLILLAAAAVSASLAIYEMKAHPGEGEGFTDVIIPTNPILLVGLSMANVSYNKWLKWTWKFQVLIFALTIGVLFFASAIGY